MDVEYTRVHGCMWIFMAVLTLGIAPLGIWWQRRQWPVRLDEQGMRLGTGAQITWGAVRAARRVAVILEGRQVAERIDLDTDRGTVRLVTSNMLAADEVVGYVLAHVPAAVRDEFDS